MIPDHSLGLTGLLVGEKDVSVGTIWENVVFIVQQIKHLFGVVKEQTLWGIPLDLPFRTVILACIYSMISQRRSRWQALWICLLLLVGKEVFDIFAVRSFARIEAPDIGDDFDLLAGLLGIAIGEIVVRWMVAKRKPFGEG